MFTKKARKFVDFIKRLARDQIGWVFRCALILSIFVSGCGAMTYGDVGQRVAPQVPPAILDGQVVPLGVRTALRGIVDAVAGIRPGTEVRISPGGTSLIFSWQGPGGRSWALVGNSVQSLEAWIAKGVGGNIGNLNTWEVMSKYLDECKWKIITGAEIAPAFRAIATLYLTVLTNSLTTMWMIPLPQDEDILDYLLELAFPQTLT